MYLTAIRVQGLRGADGYEATGLERLVELTPGPQGVAVADALSMLAAALPDPLGGPRLARATRALGLADSDGEVVWESGFPVQISLTDPAPVSSLLPVGGGRQVSVSVDMALDPPLYGRLRSLAARDPRLVTALGEGGRVTVKVGWLWTNDLGTASLSVLGVSVGDTPFPVAGSERPSWVPDLLGDLGGRFARLVWRGPMSAVHERLVAAATSADPDLRARFRDASRALEGAPFRLGALELVRVRGQVEACFGPGLLRSRQFGPAAEQALRLVDAVCIEAPDVLVVESPATEDGGVRDWLDGRVRGDDATLEQVWIVPGGGAPAPAIA